MARDEARSHGCRMTTRTDTATPPRRRIPLLAVMFVAAFILGVVGAATLATRLSAHTIAWQPSGGIGGPRFDPATAEITTVVHVEVQWPSCVEPRDYSWLTPEVSSLPWSVTITLRTSAAYAANPKCPKAGPDGLLEDVGYYLSALSFPVPLSEPLGGRPLFDGSTFPATERYRP
jgi:hypothetical protein